MKTVQPQDIQDKKVLLRLDLDVSLKEGSGDFRLKAGLPTLRLCLEHAAQVIIMGHIGRPDGVEVPELSVAPIYEWFHDHGFSPELGSGKLKLLENLRFEKGEEEGSLDYAKQLASFGEVFVNEAFASHHPAASTTVLPTLLPHFAGLRFAKEVEVLTQVRENPLHPLVVIIGGVKIEDKLPAIKVLSKVADSVLVGGKIAAEANFADLVEHNNIQLAKLTEDSSDISIETVEKWRYPILGAKQILWNGPLGKTDKGTYKVAKLVTNCPAQTIVGGGDTVDMLDKLGLLSEFSFVSTGGGAMLKFLSDGTLPTIEVLG